MKTFTLPRETLCLVLQDLRQFIQKDSPYKIGQDVHTIESAYINVVNVAGEKINKVQKTKLIVVKYRDQQQELYSLNIPFKNLYKHMPEILHL